MTYQEAYAAHQAARAEARRNPSPATRQAAIDTGRIAASLAPKQGVSNFASRAGRRQAADRARP